MDTIQIILLSLVAIAASSPIYSHGHQSNHHHENDNDLVELRYAPAHYSYEYGVHDPSTGDIKEAKESSDGHGGVKGYYKLKESDGTIRIVHYIADKHSGFNAHVEKIGKAHHPQAHIKYYKNKHQSHDAEKHFKSLNPHGIIQEIHYHGPPRHHHLHPYDYRHYSPAINHDFHIYHEKYHPKYDHSVSLEHH